MALPKSRTEISGEAVPRLIAGKRVIAICFGHVASNVGDNAINLGQIALIKAMEPNSEIRVVYFATSSSDLERKFLESLADEKLNDVRKVAKPSFEAYARDPVQALEDWGISDAELIVGSASEFVFSYGPESNVEKLLTWALPLLAGQMAGKTTLVMPSTYGPFYDRRAANLISGVLSGVSAVPVRDLRSEGFLDFLERGRTMRALDPAFFLEAKMPDQGEGLKKLAMIMRPSSGGLRDDESRLHTRKHDTRDHPETEFLAQMLEAFLARGSENTVVFIIQASRDGELADTLQKQFGEKYGFQRVLVRTPQTVDEYLDELAATDGVVSSRFHAIVLATRLGLPVFGAYHSRHGHKIPGFFEMFGFPSYCVDLDGNELPASAPAGILASLDEQVRDASLQRQLPALISRTKQWWADASVRPAGDEAGRLEKVRQIFSEMCLLHLSAQSRRFSKMAYDRSRKEECLRLELEGLNQEMAELRLKVAQFSQKAYKLARQVEWFKANYSMSLRARTRLKVNALKKYPLKILLGLKGPRYRSPFSLINAMLFRRFRSSAHAGGSAEGRGFPFPEIAPRLPQRIAMRQKTVAYVLHNSLPYSTGGYATRAQGLARALIGIGYKVHLITRPGFPSDTVPGSSLRSSIESEHHGGLNYTRIPEPLRGSIPRGKYIARSARELEKVFVSLEPSLVIGASNHQTALPALIASRRLGIPFVYEVRGFWEITRKSREPEFAASKAYRKEVFMEAETAREADLVLTLTKAMKEELVLRGVAEKHIQLAPNSVDIDRFDVRPPDETLKIELGIPLKVPVIGYIGTFATYEGLNLLVDAARILNNANVSFSMMLVGNDNTSADEPGPIFSTISQMVSDAGMGQRFTLTGRVPHDEVERYYSLCDILVYPRLSLPVTEMVSPIKPLEAMAMGKAVVVSDVSPLREIVQAGETGMVHASGSSTSLAAELRVLLNDRALRMRLGFNARNWVEENRAWRATAERIDPFLRNLIREARN